MLKVIKTEVCNVSGATGSAPSWAFCISTPFLGNGVKTDKYPVTS